MLTEEHKNQISDIEKCIYHLEIAIYYCQAAWRPAKTKSSAALLANLEPSDIQDLIDKSKEQLSYVGVEWDIEHSVIDK